MRLREVAFLVLLMNSRRGEDGDGLVEEKNSDVVNRKTQAPERIRVIGEEETIKGLKMDVDVDVRG